MRESSNVRPRFPFRFSAELVPAICSFGRRRGWIVLRRVTVFTMQVWDEIFGKCWLGREASGPSKRVSSVWCALPSRAMLNAFV